MACRRRGAKETLVRLVRRADATVAVDPGGRAPGRGAYVCRDVGCISRALQSGRLGRALRTTLSQSALAALHNEVCAVVTRQRLRSAERATTPKARSAEGSGTQGSGIRLEEPK